MVEVILFVGRGGDGGNTPWTTTFAPMTATSLRQAIDHLAKPRQPFHCSNHSTTTTRWPRRCVTECRERWTDTTGLPGPLPQGRRLSVGGIPAGPAPGQQPAEPGPGRARAQTGPGPRRAGHEEEPAWATAGWPAGGVLSRVAGHPAAARGRLRNPLRVRHLRSGDPRWLAGGRTDNWLAPGTRGRSPNRGEPSGSAGAAPHRALTSTSTATHASSRVPERRQGRLPRHRSRGTGVSTCNTLTLWAPTPSTRWPRGVQRRRLLPRRRRPGGLPRTSPRCSTQRRARGRQAAAATAAVLLRVLLAADIPASARAVRGDDRPSGCLTGLPCSSTTLTPRSPSRS